MPRSISFDHARSEYKNRFTCEHVPAWSSQSLREQGGDSDLFCAPQYKTDKEWYDNTDFPGENGNDLRHCCVSRNQSWPMGKSLTAPYRKS
jgi:hypothetical protein